MPAPAGARRFTGDRRERPTEVTLVGKANVERNIGQGPRRLPEKLGRSRNPFLDDVVVRGDAGALLERPVEVSARQQGNACENFGSEVLGQMLVDVLADAAQGARSEAAKRRAPSGTRGRL